VIAKNNKLVATVILMMAETLSH